MRRRKIAPPHATPYLVDDVGQSREIACDLEPIHGHQTNDVLARDEQIHRLRPADRRSSTMMAEQRADRGGAFHTNALDRRHVRPARNRCKLVDRGERKPPHLDLIRRKLIHVDIYSSQVCVCPLA
jgi:hypothetical protein